MKIKVLEQICTCMKSQTLLILAVSILLSFKVLDGRTTKKVQQTTKLCLSMSNTLRARHKSCFLRPDTGPCRADIIQWYFDAKDSRCYMFFWGGCQGNGNRFETKSECNEYCLLKQGGYKSQIPYYCSLSFDYGTCFGHYYRWYWDNFYKTCKLRLYSGCGGNQNNFQTMAECRDNCLTPPNNTFSGHHEFTTCMPLVDADRK